MRVSGFWPPFRGPGGEAPGPDPTGPIRAKTPTLARGIVLAGHSSLTPSNDSGILADAVGPVVVDFGQSSQEVWDNLGAARTGEYDLLIASETDSTATEYYTGLAHPDSTQGRANLQHLYWLGLEAHDRGAELALFNSPSSRFNDVDATNRQRINYYRAWLEDHLAIPVWIVPGALYIEELRQRGLTDDDIFEDQVHLRGGAVSAGAAYQAVAVVTGALPDGIPPGHATVAAAALASAQRHWWAGLGGSEFRAGLDIPDPLPAPLPRPGPPAPSADILWTAGGYTGPALTGAQPVIADGVMTFDGSGLTGDFAAAGFYACFTLRVDQAVEDVHALHYLNPAPGDPFVDPYAGLRFQYMTLLVERYPEGIEHGIGAIAQDDWTVVEVWVIADQVTAAAGPQPETSGITLFAQGFEADATYLAIRRSMPSGAERSAMRAAALASIPEGL